MRSWVTLLVVAGLAAGCESKPEDPVVVVTDATTEEVAPDTTAPDTIVADTAAADGPMYDNPKGSGESKSVTMGAAGGEITLRGVTLVVPAGAVADGTPINVIELAAPAPGAFEAATPLYAFAPDGIKFAVPAKVKFAYDQPRDAVVYWSEKEGVYAKLATERTAGFLVAELTHFSGGFVGFTGPPVDGGTVDATPDVAADTTVVDTAPVEDTAVSEAGADATIDAGVDTSAPDAATDSGTETPADSGAPSDAPTDGDAAVSDAAVSDAGVSDAAESDAADGD